jgi:hypothetical protein
LATASAISSTFMWRIIAGFIARFSTLVPAARATVGGKRIYDVSADAVGFLVLRLVALERSSMLIGTSPCWSPVLARAAKTGLCLRHTKSSCRGAYEVNAPLDGGVDRKIRRRRRI